MKKLSIALVALILVGGGVFLFLDRNGRQSSTNQATDQPSTAVTPGPLAEPAATIIFNDEGFSPTKVSIKAGETVKVVNNSSNTLQFSSDQHPVHTKNDELNQSSLQPGESQSFVLSKKGTFGFHDHLNSSKTGEIVVE